MRRRVRLTVVVFVLLMAEDVLIGVRPHSLLAWRDPKTVVGCALVVAGLALHGLFDFTRHWVMAGAGVPPWWPAFCLAADLAFAVLLAMLLRVEHRTRSS